MTWNDSISHDLDPKVKVKGKSTFPCVKVSMGKSNPLYYCLQNYTYMYIWNNFGQKQHILCFINFSSCWNSQSRKSSSGLPTASSYFWLQKEISTRATRRRIVTISTPWEENHQLLQMSLTTLTQTLWRVEMSHIFQMTSDIHFPET